MKKLPLAGPNKRQLSPVRKQQAMTEVVPTISVRNEVMEDNLMHEGESTEDDIVQAKTEKILYDISKF